VQLGFENKKKATWAIALGAVAVLALAYEIIPLFTGSSTAGSNAQAAAPIAEPQRTPSHTGGKNSRKVAKVESLDPTLRLDLLAMSEKTEYQGTGRNIFVSQAEDVKIPQPITAVNTDKAPPPAYVTPMPAAAPPIPLKFYGFASSPGEPKKIFLKLGEDVFVAGEGEIVDRRYKVMHISNTSVEIQDVLSSGPPQNIPLTQG
jgi:hypothetical protein